LIDYIESALSSAIKAQKIEGVQAVESVTLEQFTEILNIHKNRELQSVLGEILEARNEERRRPKCAKGTRDMTPL
jgi:hypothetical protein